ncbi:DNA methyltransferase [Rhizobium rhizogenes]|uniref:site-specific DNA-methyltransferase n=1 Tax=Rhizobium rhizogenes TaxID=359 RepID=UPI00286947A0|nr:DNA methyltransferase [Rhizobium rhizogenes]
MGKLYFGDNLDMLREHVKDATVDLVYLDPPFNSKAQYNVLFKSPAGAAADAQLEAFQDSWHWGDAAEAAYADIIASGGGAARILSALRSSLGETDMMAYLAMMTIRLSELHRTLKPAGSLYLHCDPTASHYLKIILDSIFGPARYTNEIVWKRSDAHNDSKQGSKHFGRIHDVLLYYKKGENAPFNVQFTSLPQSTIDKWYRHVEEETGRRYNKADVTGPGGAAKGNPFYEWNGVSRYWRYSKASMERLHNEGRLVYSASGMTYQKRYLDESKGVAIQDLWDDIPMLRGINGSRERLGYPTQKPLALLERVIATSSHPGQVILDPFCGCGTTVHAAQKLDRDWIGIDVTHHAVTVIENRMAAAFPGLSLNVEGRPRDLAGARELARRNKYQFQWWANWLFGVDQYRERRKGADRGIDGEIFFLNGPQGVGRIIISVKGGDHVGVEAVRDLRGVLDREKAELGVLVTLAQHTRPMITEAASVGFARTAHGQFPRLQLVAIGDLFAGRRPLLPVRAPFEQLKAVTPKRKKADDGQLAFTFALDGGKTKTPEGDVVVLNPKRASREAS